MHQWKSFYSFNDVYHLTDRRGKEKRYITERTWWWKQEIDWRKQGIEEGERPGKMLYGIISQEYLGISMASSFCILRLDLHSHIVWSHCKSLSYLFFFLLTVRWQTSWPTEKHRLKGDWWGKDRKHFALITYNDHEWFSNWLKVFPKKFCWHGW